jgi:hypothetical protein
MQGGEKEKGPQSTLYILKHFHTDLPKQPQSQNMQA